ncbi:Uncharacterized protein SCF082_LOCUS53314 [Durusdinium trenchii]|uniref:Uncharacterized protein n=1 Tax=Durusdinium trenchii TaxID=1381693 RepID=A0ABP0SSR3_9DINO
MEVDSRERPFLVDKRMVTQMLAAYLEQRDHPGPQQEIMAKMADLLGFSTSEREQVGLSQKRSVLILRMRKSTARECGVPGSTLVPSAEVGAFESLLKPGGPELSVDERRTLETACRVHQLSSVVPGWPGCREVWFKKRTS